MSSNKSNNSKPIKVKFKRFYKIGTINYMLGEVNGIDKESICAVKMMEYFKKLSDNTSDPANFWAYKTINTYFLDCSRILSDVIPKEVSASMSIKFPDEGVYPEFFFINNVTKEKYLVTTNLEDSFVKIIMDKVNVIKRLKNKII